MAFWLILAVIMMTQRLPQRRSPHQLWTSDQRLSRDINGEACNEEWHCKSVMGKMNFLQKSTRVDMLHSVHQCARFSADPKQSNVRVVKHIGRHWLGIKERGLTINPRDHPFDMWVDADFVGNSLGMGSALMWIHQQQNLAQDTSSCVDAAPSLGFGAPTRCGTVVG